MLYIKIAKIYKKCQILDEMISFISRNIKAKQLKFIDFINSVQTNTQLFYFLKIIMYALPILLCNELFFIHGKFTCHYILNSWWMHRNIADSFDDRIRSNDESTKKADNRKRKIREFKVVECFLFLTFAAKKKLSFINDAHRYWLASSASNW